MEIFSFIIPISIGIVALVLLAGLWNMMRGGSPSFSQKNDALAGWPPIFSCRHHDGRALFRPKWWLAT